MSQVIGVVGYGSFGKLLVDDVFSEYEVLVSTSQDIDLPANAKKTEIEELASSCNALFLCIPLSAYRSVCRKLSGKLNPNCIVVDVASVKIRAEKILRDSLPNHKNFLMTHPLFGPQSAAGGNLNGLKFVVTDRMGDDSSWIVDVFSGKGSEIVNMSADEHDKQMAYTHALTFFISHGLAQMKIKEIELTAPSYEKLLALQDLDSHHSKDLFETIQNGNPYAKETREKLLETMNAINKNLDENN